LLSTSEFQREINLLLVHLEFTKSARFWTPLEAVARKLKIGTIQFEMAVEDRVTGEHKDCTNLERFMAGPIMRSRFIIANCCS
jgi:hypothetical protein